MHRKRLPLYLMQIERSELYKLIVRIPLGGKDPVAQLYEAVADEMALSLPVHK